MNMSESDMMSEFPPRRLRDLPKKNYNEEPVTLARDRKKNTSLVLSDCSSEDDNDTLQGGGDGAIDAESMHDRPFEARRLRSLRVKVERVPVA